jgi:DNA polymerase II small subunit
MISPGEIVERFLRSGHQVHPDVVCYLQGQADPALIDRIISTIPPEAVVILPEHVPGWKTERDGTRFLTDPRLEIISGSGRAKEPRIDQGDFFHYFRDRYNHLSSILRKRISPVPIEALQKNSRYRDEEVAAIGMVVETRTTAKGHRMASLEDPTGTINVLFNKDRDGFTEAEKILPDEVIAIKGKLSPDNGLFFADSFSRPDIPVKHAPFTSEDPGKAILISDIHVGSDTFLEDAWLRFADWCSDTDAGYLLIAGDLVDGIGIYPGQEEELTIKNIYEQYDVFAGMLRDLPSHLQIVIAPGNHDMVRQSEPQPILPESVAGRFPQNVTLVENPALVSLQGVRVLMYHGRSYDDLIGMIPGASYTRPQEMMEEMLKRRLLAITYGQRTPILAAREDRMVIDPIPEILHTGHVHICGISRYRGVLGVNSGTWQSQTSFQKQMNINPTPGIATVVDLRTLEFELVDFT